MSKRSLLLALLLSLPGLPVRAEAPVPDRRPVTEADRLLLARGPVVQNVTTGSAVFLGRPVEALLKEPVTITVTAGELLIRSVGGRVDPAKGIFEVVVEGLPADTLCAYTVKAGDKETAPFFFRTAPADKRPILFCAYGDTRTRPDVHAAVAAGIFKHKPEFVTCSGDLVAAGSKTESWDPEFFEPARDVLAGAPVYPALGNHEQHSDNYFNFFSLPGTEAYYTMTWGPVRLITLDQYQEYGSGSIQYAWADKTLAEPFEGWTIVQLHEPPFGSHKKRSISLPVLNTLVPLFEKHKVDLVLCGHDHYYMRNVPLSREAGGHPVQYVITGGGGAPIYEHEPAEYVAKAEGIPHYMVVKASLEALEVRVLAPDDREIDAFTLSRAKPAVAMGWKNMVWPFLVNKELQAAAAGMKAGKDGALVLTLKNPGVAPARAEVQWETAETGWTVKPGATSAVIPPDDSASFTAFFQPPAEPDRFYPAPSVSLSFLADGAAPVTNRFPVALPNRPKTTLKRVSAAPVVDGKADEEAWKGTERLDIRWLSKGQPSKANPAEARLLAGPDALYALFFCAEDDMANTREKADPKNTVTAASDDCVEFFVSPPGAKGGTQFIVSIGGVRYGATFTWDGKAKTSPLKEEWQAAVAKGATGWTVELRAPWAALGLPEAPASGAVLGLNTTRLECNPKPGVPGEFENAASQWAVTFGPNHDIGKYGAATVE